jgi:hypothetical protein
LIMVLKPAEKVTRRSEKKGHFEARGALEE